jgi:hypothetical protein
MRRSIEQSFAIRFMRLLPVTSIEEIESLCRINVCNESRARIGGLQELSTQYKRRPLFGRLSLFASPLTERSAVMSQEKYIDMDVHQATISVAVTDSFSCPASIVPLAG